MEKYLNFWKWFILNQEDLYYCSDVDNVKFDDLASQLQLVNEDLTFECGPLSPQRQLVISAGGMERSFHDVTGLISVAPKIQLWKLVAFMPRDSLPITIEFQGESVNSLHVQFSLLDNGKMAGVHLFFPSYKDDDIKIKQIGYMLLDHVLGEYDVETKLGTIKMMSSNAPPILERYALSELPDQFDQLNNQLNATS